MKIASLDLGDVWTGIALSDSQQIIAQPYKTVASNELEKVLEKLLVQEAIQTIVVGYPKTLRGTESEQTKKVLAKKESLEHQFDTVEWVLWDERLTSQQAAQLSKAKTKEQKLFNHARAAAFILDSYLEHLRFKREIAL